jgi:hypothetical protein
MATLIAKIRAMSGYRGGIGGGSTVALAGPS